VGSTTTYYVTDPSNREQLEYDGTTGQILEASGRSGISEEFPSETGPLEVLRLVVNAGRAELRFLGHRVPLGRVKD